MGRSNKNSHNLTRLLQEAIQLHQKGDLSGAGALYRKMLVSYPNHPDALHLLGVIAQQRGDNDKAVNYIAKALSFNPSAAFYHNNLGSAYLNLNKCKEAAQCFETAIRLKPDYVEAYNNLGNVLKKEGMIEDAEKKYRKALNIKDDYAESHNNLGSLLLGRGNCEEAIGHFQTAIALKPALAEAYFNYGNALKAVKKYDEAIEQYQNAIRLQPACVSAHNNLGNLLKRRKKKYEDAILHYLKAIELQPDYAEAYNNLADAYRTLGKFSEAIENCRRAINLSPDNTLFHVNFGNVFHDMGNLDDAVRRYDTAMQSDAECADAHYNKSLILLLNGEIEEGFKEYEWRFKSEEVSDDIIIKRKTDIPELDGLPLAGLSGKTILIRKEQGVGDNIQFIRYIPILKKLGCTIMYECRKDLLSLFEGYSGIDYFVDDNAGCDFPVKPDYYVFLLSLPRILGTTLSTIPAHMPYLTVEDNQVSRWRNYIESIHQPQTGDRRLPLKVGIVWAGSPEHGNDRNRSYSLSDFASLASLRGVVLFSLQKGHGKEQLNNPASGMRIVDLGEKIEDFCDTAAAILNLDLVISVDTAVVHLAGALGKPVWTLLPFVPDWRWMMNREDSPWYPTMRLFRQAAPGDREGVMNRIVKELGELVSA